jgi:RNA polymerase sigma factor (sigma-70 family)
VLTAAPPAPPASPLHLPDVTGCCDVNSVLDDVRAGKKEALDRLIAEFSPVLWQVARAQGLDRETATDVVQTTWLTFLQRMDEIRVAEALVGWLVTVTKREAWRVSSTGRRQSPTDLEELERQPADDPLPEDDVLRAERRRLLWSKVRQLSPRCQELLRVVAFVERPDYAVVSDALGMPVGSIGPTRGRCLAKLRALLAGDPRWSES